MAGAKKARTRISYVLPLANSPGGHRLGVNGLAVDSDHSILYSGGRDGAICAWELNLDLKSTTIQPENPFESPEDPPEATSKKPAASTFRAQTQAHTHWVNDIVLAQNNTALVSASSDLTVKVWRPLSKESEAPQTIGLHADYVKCLATPNSQADWVASGGLDRLICLWDLNGAGKKLEIGAAGDDEKSEKGSVYALSASRTMIASGGPESTVRVWDPRTGKRITNFVGHTDNIRDILINESGDTIISASSDQTVKVWSVTAGRCMHTLTMHNDSVWSLYSEDPDLGVFYSGDRSGLVVKTDVRGTLEEMDDGLSLAVAQENDGVNKVIAYGPYIWTATSSSSINRWTNVDTGDDIQLPEAYRHHRASSAASRPTHLSPPGKSSAIGKKEIPAQSVLRISNTATFPAAAARDSDAATAVSGLSFRKGSEAIVDSDNGVIIPIHSLPEYTIEGQHGLVKHKLLNDRRRVLTLDTAGDVLLWDLLQCIPVRSFGKRHIEDVEPEVNTLEAVAPWCSIDTRTGRLAVMLEEYNFSDAEAYADELELENPADFKDDQRINLGRWVLRYLFANLVDEFVRRDKIYRNEVNENLKKSFQRQHAPTSIQMPSSFAEPDASGSPITHRTNGNGVPMTPGMGIGVATPMPTKSHLPGVPEDGTNDDKRASQASRTSGDKSGDYFSSTPAPSDNSKTAATPTQDDKPPKSPIPDGDKDTNGKEDGKLFGKKFRMGMSFGSKKLGRSASTNVEKPAVPLEADKVEDGSETSENGEKEKEVEDSFRGVVQRVRYDYEKALMDDPETELESKITPSVPVETPVLKLPPMTNVIIQEETSGAATDLYRGTVATVGEDAALVEKVGPMWLGDLLLRNKIPLKDPVKISFVLQPWKDVLPSVAGPDGNSRLNANRMLRVKKILFYVAERIEKLPEEPEPGALKPEEYLELYCNDQKLPITMTLATLRAHVWKGGNDVILYYKSNGKKDLPLGKPAEVPAPLTEAPSTTRT